MELLFLIPILVFILMYFGTAYLIGSIPFGLLLTKIAGLGDIRKIGSGNIGATNVLRSGRKGLALATLLLDGGKGAFVVFLELVALCYMAEECTGLIGPVASRGVLLWIGLVAIIGHCFPVWLKFKGGKGVATALGVLLAAVPFTGLIACLAWLMSFLAARISSLAALTAMAIAPVMTLVFYDGHAAFVNLLISLLVILRHKDNIKRLMKGEEPRVEKKTAQ